jgi:hypothetical protein
MLGGLGRFGGGWRRRMQSGVQAEERRMRRPPRPRRGQPPPQRPSEEEIRAAVEQARQAQYGWGARQLNQLRRHWMIGRREQLDFETLTNRRLRETRWRRPTLTEMERVPIAPYGTGVDIHPALRDLLHIIHGNPRATAPGPQGQPVSPQIDRALGANNYSRGHGSGHVAGLGLSVDLTLPHSPLGARGFYGYDDAVRLLLRVHRAVQALGGDWVCLYNDFDVANEVNRQTGTRNVVFMGATTRRGGRPTSLNWHGPTVLHFHLDYSPPANYGATPAGETPGGGSGAAPQLQPP